MASVSVSVELVGKDAGASAVIGTVAKGMAGLANAAASPIAMIGKLVTGLGAIGLAAGGIQAVAGAASGLGQSLGVGLASEMESVSARLNAFTKDSGKTAEILAQVREEANKTPFAFSEMATAASMLLPASKSAQGGLMGLIQQAEILAALNPAEGLQGASFALREALSGDFVSVMERFNIPRELINRLKAEGVPNAEIVSRALKEMGADMSLVGNLAATTEGRFSTFRDAIDGLRLVVGQPILAALGEQLDRMSGFLADNDVAIRAFAQTIGDALAGAIRIGADAVGNLIAFLSPLGPALALIGRAAVAMVHGDWDNAMAGLREAAAVAIRFLDTSFGGVGRVLASVATAALAAVNGDWSGAMTQMGAAAQRAGDVVGPVLSRAISDVQGAMSAFAPTGERLGALFADIGEAVEAVLSPLSDAAQGIAETTDVAGGAQSALDAVAAVVNGVSSALETAVGWLTQSRQGMGVLGTAVGAVGGALTVQAVAWAAASAAAAVARGALLATTAAQWLLNAAMTANPIGLVVVAIGALIGMLVAAYASNETFRNAVDAAWAAIQTAVIPAVAAVMAAIGGLVTWFNAQGGTFLGAAMAIGTSIGQGIVNGLNAGIAWVKQAAHNVGLAAVNAAKAALGIASPSKAFEEIGEQTVEGFVEGVDHEAAAAVAAVEELLAEVRSAADTSAESAFANLSTIIGAQFEKTYSLVEQAQMKSLQNQEDAQGNYQWEQDKEERQFQRKMADLKEEWGRATIKQREGINERIAQEQENHDRRLTDMAAAHEQRLWDIEMDGMDAVRKAEERTLLERGEALRDLQRGVEDLARESGEKSADIARKAADATADAIDAGAEATREAIDRASEQVQDAMDNLALNRTIRGRRDEFSAGQDAESLVFKQNREDADLLVRQAEQLAERRRRIEEDAAETDRRRSREDADAEYELARDLADAVGDEDKAKVQARFDRAKADRERRRRLDDEERERKARDDARAFEESFKKAQADLAKRRAADEVERDFRKQQQAAAQKFSDTLEDEALQRQIVRINEERDRRVASITEAMNEKLRKIQDNERREQEELRKSYEQKVADLKERFLDKVGPMTEEGMSALDRFLQGVTTRIGEVVDAAGRAASAVARIGGGAGGGSGAPATEGGGWADQSQEVRDSFTAVWGGGAQAQWEREHAAELARAGDQAMAGMPGPTGTDPLTGRPTGPGYYQPLPDTAYWRENAGRFDPLPYGTEYPEAAYGSSDSTSRDVFGGNNTSVYDSYDEGGTVPGPLGAARPAIVHGGEMVFTPKQQADMRIDYKELARCLTRELAGVRLAVDVTEVRDGLARLARRTA